MIFVIFNVNRNGEGFPHPKGCGVKKLGTTPLNHTTPSLYTKCEIKDLFSRDLQSDFYSF